MAKLKILPGEETAFGNKLHEIITLNPRDGTDVTDKLNPYLESHFGRIEIYVDNEEGVTKIVLPSLPDLGATIDVMTDEERDEYLATMGKVVILRCGK
jgi:hypothetical protein